MNVSIQCQHPMSASNGGAQRADGGGKMVQHAQLLAQMKDACGPVAAQVSGILEMEKGNFENLI